MVLLLFLLHDGGEFWGRTGEERWREREARAEGEAEVVLEERVEVTVFCFADIKKGGGGAEGGGILGV